MHLLLELNGYALEYTQDELIEIILELTSSNKSEGDLLSWVRNHIL